jgi:hypothetical protein
MKPPILLDKLRTVKAIDKGISYANAHRWQSALVSLFSLLVVFSPPVQCPLLFIKFALLRNDISSKNDAFYGFSKMGELLSLRNEAISKSCNKFTWMIPDKSMREAADDGLKPLSLP